MYKYLYMYLYRIFKRWTVKSVEPFNIYMYLISINVSEVFSPNADHYGDGLLGLERVPSAEDETITS